MLNDFQLEIVAVAVVLGLLAVYIIVKRSSASKIDTPTSEQHAKPEVAVPEPSSTSPQPKPLPILEEPVVSETPVSRRKSDKIIPKRIVSAHEKITKHHFSQFSGERILVAEDNPINQKVLIGLLAESGIELIIANDGQEVLDILEKDSDFVMILMDANMPRLDGLQATRIIREDPKYDHILVVALSGDTASDDIQKMKDAGMDEQLAKPLRMDALYNIIYAYTENQTSDPAASTSATMTLDIELGLDACGGDEGLYREILLEFIADYGKSADVLGELLRSNNLYAADALLLDIVGVSESIGAHPLGEIALRLKLAFGDTGEQSYFTLFDKYKAHSDRLVEEIREYLSS